MIEHKSIDEIAARVATDKLGAANVAQILSEATIDSEGGDALRVTIVIPEDVVEKLTGDTILDILLGVLHVPVTQDPTRDFLILHGSKKTDSEEDAEKNKCKKDDAVVFADG